MAASYPTSVKTFTTKATSDTIQASHVNDPQDEIVAIEQDILTNGLTLTSGKIKFPATQVPSAGANDLDDYEEGTWTPAVASSGGGTPTYAANGQVGRYVKVGRMVKFQCRVELATKGTLAAGGVTITGLPFTSENVTNQIEVASITWTAMTTAVVSMVAYINPNVTAINIAHCTAAATGVSNTQVSDISATVALVVSGTYVASA
jgi:hypothetical protein